MIKKHKTKVLDEDGLFNLIKTRKMPAAAKEAAFGSEDPDAPKKGGKKGGGGGGRRVKQEGWVSGGGSKASNQSAADSAAAAAAASVGKVQVQNGTPGAGGDPNASLWTVKYVANTHASI